MSIMNINKKFKRGSYTFSITYDMDSEEENLFILTKEGNFLTKLIGYSGNITGRLDINFDAIRPVCTFPDPLDR